MMFNRITKAVGRDNARLAGGLPPPVPPRRVIQIAPRNGPHGPGLWALCNDGTMWLFVGHGLSNDWERVIDIPQDIPQ